MRNLTCGDCQQPFTVASRSGPRPARCAPCKREYVNMKQREYARTHRPPAKQPVCVDCGCALEWKGSGRPPVRCQPCVAEYTNIDARRRYHARMTDPAKRETQRANGKIRYSKNAAKLREQKLAAHYKWKYGLTREDRDRMIAEQGGLCKICGKPPRPDHKGGRLHVDHCHTTKRVRGLLCGHCNTMIGLAGEDPKILLAAVEYLARDKPVVVAAVSTATSELEEKRE